MPVVWTIKFEDNELEDLENTVSSDEKKQQGTKRSRRTLLDSPCIVEDIIRNKRQKIDRGKLGQL